MLTFQLPEVGSTQNSNSSRLAEWLVLVYLLYSASRAGDKILFSIGIVKMVLGQKLRNIAHQTAHTSFHIAPYAEQNGHGHPIHQNIYKAWVLVCIQIPNTPQRLKLQGMEWKEPIYPTFNKDYRGLNTWNLSRPLKSKYNELLKNSVRSTPRISLSLIIPSNLVHKSLPFNLCCVMLHSKMHASEIWMR